MNSFSFGYLCRDMAVDDDETFLVRMRDVLTRTTIEPTKSRKLTERLRGLFSRQTDNDEQLEDDDCRQGNYHEIVPRLYLGD
jgi:hypothetical protein